MLLLDVFGVGLDPDALGPIPESGIVEFAIAETPLPGALSLFAGGLGAIGLLGWRRRRKATAIAVLDRTRPHHPHMKKPRFEAGLSSLWQ